MTEVREAFKEQRPSEDTRQGLDTGLVSAKGGRVSCATLPPTGLPPEFTLKATDRCAPAAILRWVEHAAAAGASNNKLRGAMEIYLAFVSWQRMNAAHVHTPD